MKSTLAPKIYIDMADDGDALKASVASHIREIYQVTANPK